MEHPSSTDECGSPPQSVLHQTPEEHPVHRSPGTAARQVLDQQVLEGRLPGYAAAVRHRGRVEVVVGGVLTLGEDRPVEPGTPFRLSSVTKLFAAVLALSLVEDGALTLDDEVRRWLPELAEPRVLRDPLGPLDDTEPAAAPITVHHLLTCTAGVGGVWEASAMQTAMVEAGLFPGPFAPAMSPDEYVRRLAALPLVHQPGSAWGYHTASDRSASCSAARRAVGLPICWPSGSRGRSA